MYGETTLRKFEHMLQTLPANHNLGLVNIILGNDFICTDFLSFVIQQQNAKTSALCRPLGAGP
jgi:hypothetical protein